jgi:hypothetical protein
VGVLSVHDRFTEKALACFDRASRFPDQFSAISAKEAQGRSPHWRWRMSLAISGAEVHVI